LHTFPNLFYTLPDGYVNAAFNRWGYYGRMTTKWTAKAIDVTNKPSFKYWHTMWVHGRVTKTEDP